MGKAVSNDEIVAGEMSAPPLPVQAGRTFAMLDKARSVDGTRLSVEACPLNEAMDSTLGPIGPYNALSLAGRALSLSASLSPDYCQAYLAGLEDLVALRALPEAKKTRRRR
ncbi:MAG: DUF2894 domain-containing protein [Myxococcota bacterium]|nr:DUF2894 domain-containing protein [Myxococcota bacterium]